MSRLVIFLVFGGLIGCGTDKTVAVRNTDPEAWITSHSDNAEIFVGISTLFFGSASDTNHQEIDLLTNWYVDNRELCMNVTPQVDGTTSCEIALEEGDEVLRLQVVDPLGATSFNEIRLDIIPFMVPEISWFSPIEEDAYYTDTPISFRAEVVDDQDTPDALDIVWSSSQDGVLDIASPDAEGKIEDFAFLAEGNHILSVEVTNSGGKSVEHSETVTVRAPNQPPTCGISFPSSGSSVLQGTLLTLQAQVADPDIDASYLQTSWTSDQDGLLGVGVFDNGVLMLTTNTLSPAFHSISLVAEDELGLRCTDSIQLFVGSPPTVSISTPIAAQVFTLGEVISFEGQVGDAEESSTQLDVRWSSDVDGEFAQETPTSTGMITTSFDALSAGPQQITLSATDSAGFSGSDDVAIYINTAPEQPEILLEPIAPTSVEDLTVSVVSSGDVDGDTLSFLYLWYRDNVATGNTASTLSSSETAVGETWRVEVSAFDGYTEGIVAMAEVEIINTAPDITVPVISPSTAFNDNVLTCAATATDLDQSVSVSYAWNVLSQTFTGSTLDLGSLGIMPTTEIVCIAQTIDDQLAVDTESSNLFLGNRAPLLSSHAIIPNFAYVGGDLECDAIFVDPDGETLSISYEWTSNSGVLGASQTLVLQEGDAEAGDVITCTAVVEDGYGEVVSSSAFAIVQSAPIFDVAASITPSGSVYTGTEVVCSAIATDAEDGSVPVSFSWSVGSTVVATGATYIVDSDDVAVGGVLTCTATATDMDLNESISIVDVVIENTVPQINGIQISPSSLYNDETAICSATVVDVDEVIAPSYAWSIGGQSVGTGDSLSLNSTFVLPFDTLTCTVEAIDSEGSVVEGTESIVISNRPPTEPEIVISPTLPDVGVDDLVCTMTTSSTDADGDSITYTYSWSIDGVVDTSYLTDTIPAADVGEEQTWLCFLTPNDGFEDGTSASASLTTPGACANTDCDLTVYFPDGTGIDFVDISAGTFDMGSPSGELGRESLKEAQHTVTLTHDFYMMTTEMNQAMFEVLMGYNPSFINCGVDCAIEKISWHEAVYFTNLLTEYANDYFGMNMDECYSCSGVGASAYCTEAFTSIYDCTGFRLPTEAEWEYAARGGSTSSFHNDGNLQGNSWEYTSCTSTVLLDNGVDVADLAWYCGNAQTDSSGAEVPSPIALTEPNVWGIYDMHGNVREWCNDWYAQNYGGTTGVIVDPMGASQSTNRVMRGGSWDQNPKKLRSAMRAFAPPGDNLQSFGFRVAKTK